MRRRVPDVDDADRAELLVPRPRRTSRLFRTSSFVNWSRITTVRAIEKNTRSLRHRARTVVERASGRGTAKGLRFLHHPTLPFALRDSLYAARVDRCHTVRTYIAQCQTRQIADSSDLQEEPTMVQQASVVTPERFAQGSRTPSTSPPSSATRSASRRTTTARQSRPRTSPRTRR